MLKAICFRLSKVDNGQIHMPSVTYDILLLKVLPLTFAAMIVVMIISGINTGGYSWATIKLILILFIFVSMPFACFAVITYCFAKRFDIVIFINRDHLSVKKEDQNIIYDLDSIDYFIIARTSGIAGLGAAVKSELFIVNAAGEKLLIYSDAWWNLPRKAWDRVGNNLLQMTGKKVLFKRYVEDCDGQTLERDEFHKKLEAQFKKKMGL